MLACQEIMLTLMYVLTPQMLAQKQYTGIAQIEAMLNKWTGDFNMLSASLKTETVKQLAGTNLER